MNLRTRGSAVILWLVLGMTMAGAMEDRNPPNNHDAVECAIPARPDPALVDLIRATQEVAEKSRVELARSREQNESLRRLLEQTHEELTRLREEVGKLRSSMPNAQTGTLSARPAGQPDEGRRVEDGPTALTRDAAARGEAPLAKIQDQVEMNRAQIEELDQTKVESDSRFKVRLFGTILYNTFLNTADSAQNVLPVVAPPSSAAGGSSGSNLGATLRQTVLGFALTGPRIGEARLSASADFDFWGGVAPTYGTNALGTLRMRTASAHLDGPRTSLAFGLMTPMISPLNPTSLAAVYYPGLGESGNLWQWLPQITAERRVPVNEENDLILQGGLMTPFGEEVNGYALGGRPGYESRIAFGRKLDADRRMELGVGGYFHQNLFGSGRSVDSFATTGDWQIPLTGKMELSGEAFYGRSIGLGEHSGGDIAEAFAFRGPLGDPATTIRGVYSIGGWTQLKARATPRLEFNTAFGIEDPRNRDVFSGLFGNTSRLKNQTLSANTIYRLRSNFLVSLEYRHLWSTYPDATTTNSHVNLAIGYLF